MADGPDPKAVETVRKERGSKYGPAVENLGATARMFDAYLLGRQAQYSRNRRETDPPRYKIEASDVAALMILLKMGRISTGTYHADNAVDIHGYVQIYEEVVDKSK